MRGPIFLNIFDRILLVCSQIASVLWANYHMIAREE